MDTQGNLFNFYRDTDGEQKITPVGNVSDLKQFKIGEIAGIKLDRDVNVVAFQVRGPPPLCVCGGGAALLSLQVHSMPLTTNRQPPPTTNRHGPLPVLPALQDGSSVPLPPGSGYLDPSSGQLRGPDQLVEGLGRWLARQVEAEARAKRR